MSKEAIDHVKTISDKVSEGGKSLTDIINKSCLGLEEILHYRFPVSAETKIYYEGIENGMDLAIEVDNLKDKIIGDKTGTTPDEHGNLYEKLRHYKKELIDAKTETKKAKKTYDDARIQKLLVGLSDLQDDREEKKKEEVVLESQKKDIEDQIKEKEKELKVLQSFATTVNLAHAKDRKTEFSDISKAFTKFATSSSSLAHQPIDQNAAKVELPLGNSIFTSLGVTGQSYVFYDEKSQKETKSGDVTCSVLLKDGNYKEVKIKGIKIDSVANKIVFDKVEVEGVNDDDYPLQIRSLCVRGILQDGGRGYYMDKQLSLTINQGSDNVDKGAILAVSPTVTNLFAQRFPLYLRQHIDNPHRPNGEFKKIFDDHLKQHPDFAQLSDHHKKILFDRLIQPLPTPIPVGNEYPSQTLESVMRASDIMNPDYDATQPVSLTNAPTLANPYEAFKSYVLSKKVDPKPSKEDQKDATSYSNRVARHMAPLISSFVKYHINNCLDRTDVAQNLNEYISRYATHHETQKTTPLAPAQLQAAAVSLRQCLPQFYGSNNINNSWMRLMAGKGASISDTLDNEDGTSTNYTTAVQMRTGKGVSVNIILGDEKPIILAGATPGDILAKILTGCGGRVDGDRERMMLAFATMKAIVKTCKEAGIHMTVPVNGTNGDELRVTLDDKDNIRVARYNYNAGTDSFEESSTPGDVFDEMNPDHKHSMTPDFLVNMNRVTNIMLDNQYAQFRGTMNDATSTLNNFARFMTFDRERMSYQANPRWLRGVITKLLNRKENAIQEFSFPVQTGNKTANVTYNPNGTITIELDGKVRKGKNLAKLLNPWSFRSFGGIFARQKNLTDGLEMSIMQGLYEGLSGQLMDNSRVNTYTYLVRDPRTQIVYAMYQDDDGKSQMGIIENVSRNIGEIENSSDMLLPGQNRGRCKGMPPQGVRQLSDQERAAVMARPEIMDGFMQNMLKAREEMISVDIGKYRRIGFNATGVGRFGTVFGTAVAIGAFEMGSGGLLRSTAYGAGQAVNNAVVGAGPSLGSATKSVLVNTGTALKRAIEIPLNFAAGVIGR